MKKLILLPFILIPFFIACGDDDNHSTELYVDTDMDGFSEEEGDCDDNNSEINPDATEICDLIDNNCDGQIDENIETLTYYIDNDSDGFGDINNSVQSCVEVEGYVINGEDCDDDNAAINPNALEDCDGIDNNCNGSIDENAAESLGLGPCYECINGQIATTSGNPCDDGDACTVGDMCVQGTCSGQPIVDCDDNV